MLILWTPERKKTDPLAEQISHKRKERSNEDLKAYQKAFKALEEKRREDVSGIKTRKSFMDIIKEKSRIRILSNKRTKRSRIIKYEFNFPRTMEDSTSMEVVVHYGGPNRMIPKERLVFYISYKRREKL